MRPTPIRTFQAKLSYYAVDLKSLADLNCRGCRCRIDLHQPDPGQPEQFLGTCPKCGTWSRVELKGEGGRVVILQLPEVRETNLNSPASNAGS